MAATLSLTACATPNGSSTSTGSASTASSSIGAAASIGSNIFKAAVDTQCRSSLESNTAFRSVALAMTADQQAALESKICGCVSEKAPQSVTAVELAQAAMNQTVRAQLVANTVSKTLTACASEFMGKK
jgi:hypothetical protein